MGPLPVYAFAPCPGEFHHEEMHTGPSAPKLRDTKEVYVCDPSGRPVVYAATVPFWDLRFAFCDRFGKALADDVIPVDYDTIVSVPKLGIDFGEVCTVKFPRIITGAAADRQDTAPGFNPETCELTIPLPAKRQQPVALMATVTYYKRK